MLLPIAAPVVNAGEVIPVDAQTEVLAAQFLIVGEVPQLYAQTGGSTEKA